MIDRYGRVIVDPSVPMDVTDFQRLYLGEGDSPDAAASTIHMRYPTEAKSRLSSEWSRLGMTEAPEVFFSKPSNLQRLQNATPAVERRLNQVLPVLGPPSGTPEGRTVAPRLDVMPTFANDTQRNVAIAGGYDPSTSPLQKLNAAALASIANTDRADISAADRKLHPFPLVGGTPAQLQAAQLAGDDGLVKNFLIRQRTGLSPDEFMAMEPDMRNRIKLNYDPASGTGPLGGTANPSRLDMKVIGSPEFAQAEKRGTAAQFYESLTGRSFKGDSEEHFKLRKDQAAFGRRFAESQISRGAKFDPITQKWQVWNLEEQSDPTNPLAAPRAIQKMIPATEDQNAMLNQHYSAVRGQALPRAGEADYHYRAQADSLREKLATNAKFHDRVEMLRAKMGGELTDAEFVAAAGDFMNKEASVSMDTPLLKTVRRSASVGNALGNVLGGKINDISQAVEGNGSANTGIPTIDQGLGVGGEIARQLYQLFGGK